MDELEAKVRLIEAAAQLPGVRAGVDPLAQRDAALQVAQRWYTSIAEEKSPRQARKRKEARDLGL